jgi:hypothetical protein
MRIVPPKNQSLSPVRPFYTCGSDCRGGSNIADYIILQIETNFNIYDGIFCDKETFFLSGVKKTWGKGNFVQVQGVFGPEEGVARRNSSR